VGVAHIYKNIDHQDVRKELQPRMKAASLNTAWFDLPVIDMNAKLYIRPTLENILASYDAAQ
jgi:hypothetical protein